MQDGTPWPGNNTRDHPGMIQVKSICQSLHVSHSTRDWNFHMSHHSIFQTEFVVFTNEST